MTCTIILLRVPCLFGHVYLNDGDGDSFSRVLQTENCYRHQYSTALFVLMFVCSFFPPKKYMLMLCKWIVKLVSIFDIPCFLKLYNSVAEASIFISQ